MKVPLQWMEARRQVHRLQQQLRQFVPQNMLPQLVFMERFPLTPSGKIDVEALPLPNFSFGVDEVVGEREKLLADAWKKVLGVSHVSRQENFFDLGGNSINIIELYEMLQESFPQIKLVDLFEHSTIMRQAQFITALSSEDHGDIKVRMSKKRQRLLARKKQGENE